jgi:hypothetical protein
MPAIQVCAAEMPQPMVRSMSIFEQALRLALTTSDDDTRPMPSTSHQLRRPDDKIVNETIPLFAVGRNQAGQWIARDFDTGMSGAFFSKKAAIRFAKKINGPDCALMFLADGLELDGTVPRDARRLSPSADQ